MNGPNAEWSSALILQMLSAAAKSRMRVGYVEFSDRSTRYSAGGAPPVPFPLGPAEQRELEDIPPEVASCLAQPPALPR